MADNERELTLQFKHKLYGNTDKVETSRAWIERQLRACLHNNDLKLEVIEDKVFQTDMLPGMENV